MLAARDYLTVIFKSEYRLGVYIGRHSLIPAWLPTAMALNAYQALVVANEAHWLGALASRIMFRLYRSLICYPPLLVHQLRVSL